MLKLIESDTLPDGFLELSDPTQLFRLMPQPTLLHLQGRRPDTLFVTVLLHGNEDTSFYAIQEILRRYQHKTLPRSLSIFFGNVEAARFGQRHLNNQQDFNRVWPGTELPECEEIQLMRQVVEKVAKRNLFASIDVHNNTGTNPYYGCVNVLDQRFLYLAQLFSRTVVFFETPRGVQSMAMAEYCPSVTIECGKTGIVVNNEKVVEFIDAVLHLDHFPEHPLLPQDINLIHTVARVTVPEDKSFSFKNTDVDIQLLPELEHYNFTELPPHTLFACNQPENRLLAWDDNGVEVGQLYFEQTGQQLLLSRSVIPAMLTLDENVIRQDCLCYLMERLPLPEPDKMDKTDGH
ncbi:MAG: peptidase M14 [Thiothrix nivea]|nr:MAG: peptidase M14 [Thiothrix nivea]